ncbi:ectoine/hydroxyectoine ABC transporter ATP-binding protein EhuA [Pseudogemmobacter sonorensis]|uniref:ectoine/hydroxyectoine ABC transporter ATP-binding protein EhuA n=1 Tax=Pseudogemmobacter sonorensis TaxID=2989681 RepID=UPI0036925967
MTEATTPPAIVFDDVSKRFGETVVLDHFDLTVPQGEKLVLIGPSGSGKSTLLRLLMTLDTIDAGRIRLGGELLADMTGGVERLKWTNAHLRRMRNLVGMVFQQFNLFPHMTALENVASGLRYVKGVAKEAAQDQAAQLLGRVGLADKLGHYPIQLSGGQQQRVAIARALALSPQVMLFDEVTSALDPELVSEVLDVMRELSREGGLTMIVVTHQMGVARALADRVCFLEKGRLVEQGPPGQVLDAPQNPRTQAFLRAVQLT